MDSTRNIPCPCIIFIPDCKKRGCHVSHFKQLRQSLGLPFHQLWVVNQCNTFRYSKPAPLTDYAAYAKHAVKKRTPQALRERTKVSRTSLRLLEVNRSTPVKVCCLSWYLRALQEWGWRYTSFRTPQGRVHASGVYLVLQFSGPGPAGSDPVWYKEDGSCPVA